MSQQKSLRQLFADLPRPFRMMDAPDALINGISIDSRAVQPGQLFVAMTGGTTDGTTTSKKRSIMAPSPLWGKRI
jgi:UDP-N-acetylmuramyl pentapeptide synthase